MGDPEPTGDGGPHPSARGLYRVARIVDLGVCERCGWLHTRCKAHRNTSRTEGVLIPCRAPALKEQLVCKVHGGKSPQAHRAAQLRIARTKARGEVGELLAEARASVVNYTGVEHLTDAIVTAASMARAYRWLLDELHIATPAPDVADGDEDNGAALPVAGLVHVGPRGDLTLHPYEEGLRHWTRLHGELVRNAAVLGIEDRRAAIAAEQVEIIGGAIVALVEGLGRDLRDPAVAPVVEAALHTIASGD